MMKLGRLKKQAKAEIKAKLDRSASSGTSRCPSGRS